MTVKEIIIKALRDGGFDGLCTEECTENCGCTIEDMAPCCLTENILSCIPGYKGPSGGIFAEKPDAPTRAHGILADLDANPGRKTAYIARHGVTDYLRLTERVRKETPCPK